LIKILDFKLYLKYKNKYINLKGGAIKCSGEKEWFHQHAWSVVQILYQ